MKESEDIDRWGQTLSNLQTKLIKFLCSSFNFLCIDGIVDLLYLSVLELLTTNLSGFLFCIECKLFFNGNIFLNCSSLSPFFANLKHKASLLSYNVYFVLHQHF